MFRFCILPAYVLLRVTFCVIITVSLSSCCVFSDEKTLLKIWVNPGLNLRSFEELGPGESLSSGYVYQGNQTRYAVDNDLPRQWIALSTF